jgi:hypothetical protein
MPRWPGAISQTRNPSLTRNLHHPYPKQRREDMKAKAGWSELANGTRPEALPSSSVTRGPRRPQWQRGPGSFGRLPAHQASDPVETGRGNQSRPPSRCSSRDLDCRDQVPFAARTAGRRTRMRRTAIQSIAAVLVVSAARARRSRSTAVRRETPAECCADSDRTFVLF